MKKNKHEVQTIFVVLLLDFLGSFKPKANLYFKEYEGVMHADEIENAYNVFYKECKTEQRVSNLEFYSYSSQIHLLRLWRYGLCLHHHQQ